jgi:NADH dehydrogenase [ubiquinone] 1 alpha subcomplex assembly factor 5
MVDLFDRKLLAQNRKRSARNFEKHNFLHHEIASRIVENLELLGIFVNPLQVLEIGARDGFLSQEILEHVADKSQIFQTEFYRDEKTDVIADEEFLPFKTASFDLIVSNLNFHFLNEVPRFLLKVKSLLKPGGTFIASFFGEENLSEILHAIHESEQEIYQRISPRMPPTIDVKSAAALLHKAGFNNPISDFEKIEVEYSSALTCLKELQAMAQGNVLAKRSKQFFTKKLLEKVLGKIPGSAQPQLHIERDAQLGLRTPGIVVTFEIVTICGKN